MGLAMDAIMALSKKAIEKLIKDKVSEANEKISKLISDDLYDYSNTMQRYHQVRMQEDYIGRVERTSKEEGNEIVSAKFLTGTSHYTKNQLALRLRAIENFLEDRNVQEDVIREHQEQLARRMFNIEPDVEVTPEQIEDTKAVWNLWRKLGMSRDHFDESSGVLTEITKQYEFFGKDEAADRLMAVKEIAAAVQKTHEDVVNMLAGGHTNEFLKSAEIAPNMIDETFWDSFL